MKKQQKTLIILLVLLIIAIVAYFGLKKYSSVQEEKDSEEEEAAKVYITDVNTSDITAFSYEVSGEALTFNLIDDEWVCAEYQDVNLDQDKVKAIAEDFDSMEASQIVDDPMDLSEYGFDSPTNILTFTTTDGNTVQLTVGNKNDITGEYYMTTTENDNLYLVDSSTATGFDSTIDDLTAEEEETEETEATDTETADTETESTDTETVEAETEEE